LATGMLASESGAL